MSGVIEQVKQLESKLTETLEASHTAQKACDEVSKKFNEYTGENDATVKAAAEAATKAAEEAQNLKAKIDSVEQTAKYLEKMISRNSGTDDNQQKEMEDRAHHEFCAYMKNETPISNEVRELTAKTLFKDAFYGLGQTDKDLQIKALIEGTNPTGGYFIRPERSARMIQRIFETSSVRQVADVMTTTSKSVELIIDDNEAASGGWVGETSSRTETGTPDIGLLTIPIHEQFAQPKATQTMLEDAGIDLESWLSGKVTRKMIRTENQAFVVGDGSRKPKGFLSYAPWTVAGQYERDKIEQVNSGVAGGFTADGIKALQNSVIEDYQASAVFGIKRASWTEVITLKDGVGQYLLNPESMRLGDTLTLLGKRVIFMNDIQDIANDALAMVYGDFGVGYTIVDRIGFRVVRDEVTTKPFILFYTTKRVGGAVTNFESIKIQKLAA